MTMDSERCWFCGVADAHRQNALPIGLTRDVKYVHLLIAVWSRWTQIEVLVPRCQQCHEGHKIERRLMPGVPAVVLAVAVIVGGMYEEGWLSWPPASSTARDYLVLASVIMSAAAVGLAFIGWIILQLGWFGVRHRYPHPRRYARKYPAVQELLQDGWSYGIKPNFFK